MIGDYHEYIPFTKLKQTITTPDGVAGVCKVENLNANLINAFFGSIPYTENYDELPLVVRMWLSTKRWEEIKNLAKAFDCADRIYYSDFVEHDEESMLALPLIICNDYVAACTAPRVVEFDAFDIKQEVEMLPINHKDLSKGEK